MKTLPIAVLAFFIAVGTTADAQLADQLKGMAKKALEDKLNEQDRARPPARKDANREYAPGLSFSGLLNGVVMHAEKGKFRLEQIRATFLPDDCKEGWTVLRTADGRELHQFDWRPQTLKKPFSLLDIHTTTDLASGKTHGTSTVELKSTGDYVLDFYIPGEHFYTLPFSVVEMGGDDPFGTGKCYTLNGAWQDWGYLYYRDAKPDQNLEWKVWLRNEGCEQVPVKIHIEITRDQDGKIVCTSRPNTTHSLQPGWTRIAFGMVFPEGREVPHGTYFKAKDLLQTDGPCTLTMTINNQPYGTWKFNIDGAKPAYTGRTVRGTADPLTFVEGGRDAWWYAKVK